MRTLDMDQVRATLVDMLETVQSLVEIINKQIAPRFRRAAHQDKEIDNACHMGKKISRAVRNCIKLVGRIIKIDRFIAPKKPGCGCGRIGMTAEDIDYYLHRMIEKGTYRPYADAVRKAVAAARAEAAAGAGA